MYACLKRRSTAEMKKNLLSPTNDKICFSISTLSNKSVADLFVSADGIGTDSFPSTPADSGGSGDIMSRLLRIPVMMSSVATLLSFVDDADDADVADVADVADDAFASGCGGGDGCGGDDMIYVNAS